MILIDTPIYWHRGRYWCHMVSDVSLGELHAFAADLGVPRRAFQDRTDRNHPHYDLPAELYERAVQLGASMVSGTELTRRMVRYADRPAPHHRRAARPHQHACLTGVADE